MDTNVDYYNGARVHTSLDGDIPTEIGGKSTTRRAEAEYALAQIRKLPWVDQDQVFLIGFSQGDRIVASWEKSGFAARIVKAVLDREHNREMRSRCADLPLEVVSAERRSNRG